MIFRETKLKGAYLIEVEPLQDERGFFARSWCRSEVEAHGLKPEIAQCNISFNRSKGTLRGLHFQVKPHEEAKWIRCTRGAIYDVIIDLRRTSPTFMQHLGVALSAETRQMLYVPEGFAHGFITLTENAEVFYQMSSHYNADAARGLRWNDPALGIEWPIAVEVISMRDANYPDCDGRNL
jgi:dTDP-4-dehydrorhamnose 3,5-epimerase